LGTIAIPFIAALIVIKMGRTITKKIDIAISVVKLFLINVLGSLVIAVSITHPIIIAPKASAIPTEKLANVAKRIVFLAPFTLQSIKGKNEFGGGPKAFSNGFIILEKKLLMVHQFQ
tara:strand:- start:842 stop:1192 length:351 start_codon:yes stop_codon:yes gene_type:complete